MLFDLFNGPVVELVDVKSSQVVFRSRKPLAEGRPVAVRLSTGNGRAVPARVSVTASRPLGQGFAYSALLEEEIALPEFNATRLAGSDPFLRRSARLECRLRVLSPELPGFHAVSVDFSPGGLQVEARGAVSVGRELSLHLEFESLPPLEVQARVAWCAPRELGGVRVGLQFVYLTDQARAQLERYEQQLLKPRKEPCGRVLSFSVEGSAATLVFRTHQGPTLGMRFTGYRGLTDRGGRAIGSLREAPEKGFTRYQFLDDDDQVALEVLAADCTSEL